MKDINKYYEMLGLKPGTTKEEIEQTYKDLLNVWNPDDFNDEPSLQQKAREKVKEIDETYKRLMLHLSKQNDENVRQGDIYLKDKISVNGINTMTSEQEKIGIQGTNLEQTKMITSYTPMDAVHELARKMHLPGVKVNQDGTIEFSLTDEEAWRADLALNTLKGVLLHPEAVDRVPHGMVANALSRYAKELFMDLDKNFGMLDSSESEFKPNWNTVHITLGTLEKAVAAFLKAYCLSPLPIFLYHIAAFTEFLGETEQSKNFFSLFIERQAEFRPDSLDKVLLESEGTDVAKALSHARKMLDSKKHYDEDKIDESSTDCKFKNRETMKTHSIKETEERRQSLVSEESNIITFWASKFKKS
jgi:curved DNA-binding protein CbpA